MECNAEAQAVMLLVERIDYAMMDRDRLDLYRYFRILEVFCEEEE